MFQVEDRRTAYGYDATLYTAAQLRLLRRAQALLARSICRKPFGEPAVAKDYMRYKLAGLAQEVFGALWLDCQWSLIADDVLFTGTLTCASVYPRELVKRALALNAGGVLLYHNHPSLSETPSPADEMLTQTIRQAFGLIEVRVLDHIVVSGDGKTYSMAEHGLL